MESTLTDNSSYTCKTLKIDSLTNNTLVSSDTNKKLISLSLNNDATKFLNGTGTFTTVSEGFDKGYNLSKATLITNMTFPSGWHTTPSVFLGATTCFIVKTDKIYNCFFKIATSNGRLNSASTALMTVPVSILLQESDTIHTDYASSSNNANYIPMALSSCYCSPTNAVLSSYASYNSSSQKIEINIKTSQTTDAQNLFLDFILTFKVT